MVAARASAPGLSPADLERIRDTLAAGRKPKVSFTETAGQIAGQIGQVVALTDPQLSDEWLVVRFGRDQLPFSPADLAIAARPAPTRRDAPPSAATRPVPNPREESSLSPSAQPTSTGERAKSSPPSTPRSPATPAERRGTEPGGSVPAAATSRPPATPPAARQDTPAPAPAAAPPASAVRPAATSGEPKSARKPRPKVAASLTVTLVYADGEWMVSAAHGAKPVAKPYVVRAAEALKMVSLLDVPAVHEAVEEIVSAARAEAQGQAERLRAQLAEVEARLAELRE